MFGKNKQVAHTHDLDGQTLLVQEIFGTIQGEGPLAGVPAFFIRLAGCNLRCHFCDTDFESNATPVTLEDIERTILEIAEENNLSAQLVVITGGEPLLQNIAPLCSKLLKMSFSDIQIETAGTTWPESLTEYMGLYGEHSYQRISLVCSPKTPNLHPRVVQYCRDYKYKLYRFNCVTQIFV